MKLVDNILNSMKYNEDDYLDDDEYLDEEEDYSPVVRQKRPIKSATIDDDYDSKSSRSSNKVTSIGNNKISSRQRSGAAGMEVCVIKPTSVEDGREITDTLLANRTVVLNVEGLDMEIAQRIIDFASGSTYAINGDLQKISHYIFIITPSSVDISGDFQEILSGAFEVPALNMKY